MKALVKKFSRPGLWLETVEQPPIGPYDVLIRIEKTAICGTDIHIYNWDSWAQAHVPTPLTIGHEFFGTIAEVGCEVVGISKGDRVSGEGHITCSHCRNCRAGKRHLCRNTRGVGVQRPGAFAEYLSLPACNVFKVSCDIPDEIAALLDPYGNAVHTALSFDLVGEDVLITGAGPIGIMAAAVCRHVGARHVVVTDVNDKRLAIAKEMGASHTLNPCKGSLQDLMVRIGMAEGFDVGLEMSGNTKAFEEMLNSLNHGARVGLLGIFPERMSIDWSTVVFKGLVIKGIYGREMFETWYKMASMLQSGLQIEKVITHRLALEDYEHGFDLLNNGAAVKVILDWCA